MSRFAAFGVDYLAVATYIAALWVAVHGLGIGRGPTLEGAFTDSVRAQLLGFVLLTLPVVAYFAAWERSRWQATPGKKLLGLRVMTAAGGRLPWSRSVVRSAVKFAPWELAHACLWRIPGWPASVESVPTGAMVGLGTVWLMVALYIVTPLVTRARQTPYDWLAGSVVAVAARSQAAGGEPTHRALP